MPEMKMDRSKIINYSVDKAIKVYEEVETLEEEGKLNREERSNKLLKIAGLSLIVKGVMADIHVENAATAAKNVEHQIKKVQNEVGK